MNPTIIYSSNGIQIDCEIEVREGGVESIGVLIRRLAAGDGVIIAEYLDQRKYVLTAAGDDEVYIEEYDGGIEGKIVSQKLAGEFLHNLLAAI